MPPEQIKRSLSVCVFKNAEVFTVHQLNMREMKLITQEVYAEANIIAIVHSH